MPQPILFATIMFLTGVGIPILAAVNGALGVRLGSPAAAALILFLVAVAVAMAAMLVTGGFRGLIRLPGTPLSLFSGGFFVAFYVLSVTWIAPRFGVGNAVFFVLLGQLVAAAAIDHFALFGARQTSLTWARAAGLALMAAGVLLARRP